MALTPCPICASLQNALDHAHTMCQCIECAQRLLEHKLTAHPHTPKRLPWEDWPKVSPLESKERGN